jgi:pyruvate/2-oxoglutarate/acetoin dehydrogenase E1 component
MALRGLRPVVEIMFGDFLTLAADQIINSLTKFPWMYNEQVDVPIVIRTPMGGRRGYGPTHSQTLEKFFLGVPGLRVLAPTALGNPGELLSQAILEEDAPVLFIENKVLYAQRLPTPEVEVDIYFTTEMPPDSYAPTFTLSLAAAPPATLTLCAYGYMAELAKQAILILAYDYEIFAELVIPTQLAPFELFPLFESIGCTGRLLAIEEGTFTMGWGAEVLARAAERFGHQLQAAGRVAAQDLPTPASAPMEESVLPTTENIIQAARKMV